MLRETWDEATCFKDHPKSVQDALNRSWNHSQARVDGERLQAVLDAGDKLLDAIWTDPADDAEGNMEDIARAGRDYAQALEKLNEGVEK